MSNDIRHLSYPYVLMNHLTMMLFMLKFNLFFPRQLEKMLDMQVQVIPPHLCPENNKPFAMVYSGPGNADPLRIRGITC